jgi:hypothetical protein
MSPKTQTPALVSRLREAISYVDLFLNDLQADEPAIEYPAEMLTFIAAVLEQCETLLEHAGHATGEN